MNNKFIIIILIIASILILTNLHKPYLRGDESQTTLLARSILEKGYPNAKEGDSFYVSVLSLINDSKYNTSVIFYKSVMRDKFTGYNNVWIVQPPLQTYFLSLFYFIFGESTFISRLPFAILGLITIFFLYYYLKKETKDPFLYYAAPIILSLSYSFLFYIRQSRYYSIAIFLSLLVVYSYSQFLKDKKSFLLILSSALLFYTHYLCFAVLLASITIFHFITFLNNKKKIFNLIKAGFIIFLLILPFLIIAFPYWGHFLTIDAGEGAGFSILNLIKNSTFLFAQVNNYIIPLILFIPIIFLAIKNKNKDRLLHFITIITIIQLIIFVFAPTLRFRFSLTLFPLTSILLAYLFKYSYKKNKIFGVIFIIILIFTNIFNIIPFTIIKQSNTFDSLYSSRSDQLHKYLDIWSKPRSYFTLYTKRLFNYKGDELKSLDEFINSEKLKNKKVIPFDTRIKGLAFYSNIQIVEPINPKVFSIKNNQINITYSTFPEHNLLISPYKLLGVKTKGDYELNIIKTIKTSYSGEIMYDLLHEELNTEPIINYYIYKKIE